MSLTLKKEWEDQMVANGITVHPLELFWRLFPDCTFETALGGVLKWASGEGQVRTEPLGTPGAPSEDFVYATSVAGPSGEATS